MTNRSKRDLCVGPLLPKMLFYALPVMATGILQVLYNAADTFVVALSPAGDTAVAAISSTGSLTGLIINLFIGLCTGVLTVVARHIGAHHHKRVRQSVHTAMTLAIICGVFLMVVGFFVSKPLLIMMGTGEDGSEVLEKATLYMRIHFLGMPAFMIYNFGASILRAAGDTKRPLTFLALSGLANVVLNLVFVLGVGMDVAGVGIATIVSQYISAVLVTVALLREESNIRLELSHLRIYRKRLFEILRLGIPSGIQSSLFAFSNVLIQSTINSFGAAHMAASGAAGQIENILYTAMNGFYTTTMAFTSQNFGARKKRRIRQANMYGHLLNALFAIGIGIVILVFARPLLGLFLDSEVSMQAGLVRVRIIAATAFLCGAMDVQSAHLRGLGFSITPMFTTLAGACGLRVLWILLVLPLFTDDALRWQMLFVCYPITWVVTMLCHLIYTRFADRRVFRLLSDDVEAEAPAEEDDDDTADSGEEILVDDFDDDSDEDDIVAPAPAFAAATVATEAEPSEDTPVS